MANSVMFVLPRMTAPFRRKLAMTGASCAATLSARARLPAVVCSPCTSMLSFTRMGRPKRGSVRSPAASIALACSSAVGSISATALRLL